MTGGEIAVGHEDRGIRLVQEGPLRGTQTAAEGRCPVGGWTDRSRLRGERLAKHSAWYVLYSASGRGDKPAL